MRTLLRLSVAFLAVLASCRPAGPGALGGPVPDRPSAPAALDLPASWTSVIADYGRGGDTLSLREAEGQLELVRWHGTTETLVPVNDTSWRRPNGARVFARLRADRQAQALVIDGESWSRFAWGTAAGQTFRITPVRPVEELRREALAATPPAETGDFLASDLVDVAALDSTIRLDVRYATTNNFMSAVFYSSARVRLQRPAAEAVVRAHRALRRHGYGLLLHDGYRPWYVTRMFWDATPDSLRVFVANPTNGSRHNRGAAIDLSLYDLQSGRVVDLPSGYDEFSPRAYPDYPGGTTLQRMRRTLLRNALEQEGFAVYEAEWWHYDYKDWRRYRIGNTP